MCGLSNCFIVSLYEFLNVSLYEFLNVSLYEFLNVSLYEFLIVSLSDCLIVSLYEFLNVPFNDCLIVVSIIDYVMLMPQLVSEYLSGQQTAMAPQTFHMGSLLQEMREIEGSEMVHAPQRGESCDLPFRDPIKISHFTHFWYALVKYYFLTNFPSKFENGEKDSENRPSILPQICRKPHFWPLWKIPQVLIYSMGGFLKIRDPTQSN